jgi:hypothetical protein
MLRNLIVLPDGTEIFSGTSAEHTVQSCTITSSVNSDTELTVGSVCSAALECRFFTPGGNLNIPVGKEVTLYKVDDGGNRTRSGLFTLQSPERPSRNTYKITAYDRVSWLDRDITPFLKSLDGWPYSLLTLAQMVCEDCLLTLVNDWIPNGNFPVNKFPANKMTARELMGHIGQLCGRFCRATPDGDIEFAWYEDSGVVLRPTGERFFNTLKYEDYQVEKIDIVQVQMAEGEYGLLFPEGKAGDNAYVISGNPLITFVNEDLQQYLDVLRWEIGYSIYTPCRVTLPACLDIRPGHIVRIIDRDDRIIDTYVMTKIQKGQKDTLESTGSARRDSPSVVSAKTPQDYADAAMKRQTQTDIFNKLTNYGSVEGLFLEENGQIFVNAAYIATGILQSKDGSTFYLDLDNGILEMDASSLSISGESIGSVALKNMTQQELVDALTRQGAADGIYLKDGQIYINAEYIQSGTLKADFITSGVLKSADGKAFYLDLDMGTFKMAGTGKFLSEDGKSYMTMDGGSFVLRTQGEDEKWAAIAKIGFSEDSNGVDYPYMLMGHAVDSAEEQNLTLVKTFSNGIYIGNAVPKLNTGKFLGLPGAVGFFVDIENKKTYNVVGDELYDAFTAVFG